MYTHRVVGSQRAEVKKQLALMRDRIASGDALDRGDHGAAITALQKHLKIAGLYDGDASGQFNAATEDAVKALQSKTGRPVTGAVDAGTFQSVKSIDLFVKDRFDPKAEQGQRGTDVRTVESQLQKLGRKPGKADGIFTERTEGAVRAFQRAHDLRPTGDINARTADEIHDAYQATLGKRVKAYIDGDPRWIRVMPVGDGEYMRTDAAGAYKKMMAAADRAGLNLSSVSGFRTMEEQRRLWNLYGPPRAARPGYSNHQGGISMDIGGIGGYGTRAYHWLANHARQYGFVNDVPNEPWHWTYKR